jgi:hypothetical protein
MLARNGEGWIADAAPPPGPAPPGLRRGAVTALMRTGAGFRFPPRYALRYCRPASIRANCRLILADCATYKPDGLASLCRIRKRGRRLQLGAALGTFVASRKISDSGNVFVRSS